MFLPAPRRPSALTTGMTRLARGLGPTTVAVVRRHSMGIAVIDGRRLPVLRSMIALVRLSTTVVVHLNTPAVVRLSTTVVVHLNTPAVVRLSTTVVVRLSTPVVVRLSTTGAVRLSTPVVVRLSTSAVVRLSTPVVVHLNTSAVVRLSTPVVVRLSTPVVVRRRSLIVGVRRRSTTTVLPAPLVTTSGAIEGRVPTLRHRATDHPKMTGVDPRLVPTSAAVDLHRPGPNPVSPRRSAVRGRSRRFGRFWAPASGASSTD